MRLNPVPKQRNFLIDLFTSSVLTSDSYCVLFLFNKDTSSRRGIIPPVCFS
uniref:Uncharacterized protein n=1 Tax=Schistosoma japonicum TaxID=6182 RepID=Q5BYV7_SCHJA|nr:unknown [Schistosoma japonicum]